MANHKFLKALLEKWMSEQGDDSQEYKDFIEILKNPLINKNRRIRKKFTRMMKFVRFTERVQNARKLSIIFHCQTLYAKIRCL